MEETDEGCRCTGQRTVRDSPRMMSNHNHNHPPPPPPPARACLSVLFVFVLYMGTYLLVCCLDRPFAWMCAIRSIPVCGTHDRMRGSYALGQHARSERMTNHETHKYTHTQGRTQGRTAALVSSYSMFCFVWFSPRRC